MALLVDEKVVTDNLSKKSDTDLLEILCFHQNDYDPSALLIIDNILLLRGVPREQIEDAHKHFKPLPPVPEKESRWMRVLLWLLTAATLAMGKYLMNQFFGVK